LPTGFFAAGFFFSFFLTGAFEGREAVVNIERRNEVIIPRGQLHAAAVKGIGEAPLLVERHADVPVLQVEEQLINDGARTVE
jgi:hypothetical protein